jgi:hypothetical protein
VFSSANGVGGDAKHQESSSVDRRQKEIVRIVQVPVEELSRDEEGIQNQLFKCACGRCQI